MKLNEIERIAKSRIECKSMSTIRRLQHMQDEEKYHASVLKMIERIRAADQAVEILDHLKTDMDCEKTNWNTHFKGCLKCLCDKALKKYRQLSEDK